MRAVEETGIWRGRAWVKCTNCDEDGLVRCGWFPALQCPICFGSKHDYRSEEQRKRDTR
jgi:hypothetical protein